MGASSAASFTQSLWYETAQEPAIIVERFPGSMDVDVAIVGGGYTGCSAALRLADCGVSVALFESPEIGVLLIVGRTEEVRAKYQSCQDLIHTDVGLMQLSRSCGVDLSGYDLDGPMPQAVDVQGPKSCFALIAKLASEEGLTIRQLYMRLAGTRDHWLLIGSPARVADELEEWFVKGGADGFKILPAIIPGGLADIVGLLIPELQRRGLFRRAHEGRTLRENLGLRKPPNGWRSTGARTQADDAEVTETMLPRA
jgi:ribosomal protein S9